MSAIQISEVLAALRSRLAAEAIRTAFHPTTPGFRGLIDRFLADRERLFKGPYVSVALPLQQGSGRDWFPQIPLPFPPYRHQEKAFDRLLPGSPRNTLVATGTGSGKTECFLLPLLEHCRQQQAQGQQGGSAENPSRHPAHQLQTNGLFADPAPGPGSLGAQRSSTRWHQRVALSRGG